MWFGWSENWTICLNSCGIHELSNSPILYWGNACSPCAARVLHGIREPIVSYLKGSFGVCSALQDTAIAILSLLYLVAQGQHKIELPEVLGNIHFSRTHFPIYMRLTKLSYLRSSVLCKGSTVVYQCLLQLALALW